MISENPQVSSVLQVESEAKPSAPQLAENTVRPSDEAVDRGASLLRHATAAMFLFGASRNSPLGDLPFESFTKYLEQLCDDILRDIANVNPLIKQLVEQAALMHYSISQLYCEAAQQTDCEKKRSHFQLATSLTGEFRRVTGEILAQCKTARQSAAAGSSASNKGCSCSK